MKTRTIIGFIGLVLLALVSASAWPSTVGLLGMALVIILLFGWMIRGMVTYKDQKGGPDKVSGSSSTQSSRSNGWDGQQFEEGLARLNLRARTTSYLPLSLVVKLEEIIDLLRSVVPDMMRIYPAEMTSEELVDLANDKLPKLLDDLDTLETTERDQRLQTIQRIFLSISESLAGTKELIRLNETDQLEISSGDLLRSIRRELADLPTTDLEGATA